jgi:transcriptional regulator with XRE-family HTH domain
VVAQVDQRRRELGLSHEELAKRAGVHRTTVGLVISGKRGVTVELAAALSLALDTPLSVTVERAEVATAAGEKRGLGRNARAGQDLEPNDRPRSDPS